MKKLGRVVLIATIIAIFILAIFLIARYIRGMIGYNKLSSKELSGPIAEVQESEVQRDQRIQEQIAEEKKEWQKEWEMIRIADSSRYPQAEKKIIIGKGMIVDVLSYQQPGKTYKWITKHKNGETWKEAEETGYLYIYTYKDLGIKISTPLFLQPYFYEKTDKPLIVRNGNILYAPTADGIISAEYLEVFFKDPRESFEDEIRKQRLSSGCSLQTGTVQHGDSIEKHMNGFQRIGISTMDGNMIGDENCKMDKQFPINTSSFISFYMDPKKPDRYYKISFNDACAPGPCSIFGDIEFF